MCNLVICRHNNHISSVSNFYFIFVFLFIFPIFPSVCHFADKKSDLSPEEWGVDQSMIAKLKEEYKKARKGKKFGQRKLIMKSYND